MREATAKKEEKVDETDAPGEQAQSIEADDEDEVVDDKPDKDAKPEKRSKKEARESKPLQELRESEDRNLKDWLEEIAPGGALRVKVTRTSPKVWKGLNVGGSLATYDQQIDEDWIRDHHGGGDFYLVVQKPKTNGAGWQYAGGRVIRIAGDPRTDDVFRDKSGEQPAGAAAANNPATGIVDRVVGSLERQLERAQEHSRGPVHTGPDTETMRLMLAPLQSQIDQMGQMLREKDRQLAAAQAPRPVERDEFRDRMLATMMEGDSARLVTLREQHASELRQLKENAIQNENRLRDAFERDKQMLSMSHERELNAIRSAYDLKVAAQESAHSTTKQLLEGEVRRLQSDLTEAKSELTALRLKKDKGAMEMLREANELRDLVADISGDKDERSTFDKVAEAAAPLLQNVMSKFGEQQQAPAPPPPPQRPPQSRLLQGPDGNLYRQTPDGQVELVRQRASVARPPAGQQGSAPMPDIPAATIKVAVEFLETAFRNGQDPTEVATSVRSMIPSEVLGAIRDRGVDGFLTDVAKLDGSSPLASQAGRNWSRKLGKALLGQ